MAHKIYVDNVTVIDAATMNDVDAVVYTNSKLVTDIHTAPPKATPVDADELGIWNSVGSVLGKVTFSNLWLWIAAYTGNVTNKTFTTGNAFNGTLGATTPAAASVTTLNASGNATLAAASVTTLNASGAISSTTGDVNLKTNTALADAAATLTAAQLSGGEFTITPTVARILTLDTAANIITNLTGSVDNSNFEINIVNLAAFDVTLATGVGVTIVGRAVINNGSATFRVRRLTSTTVEVKRLEGVAEKVLQVVNVQTGAFATGTTIIPFDDTIPQITEGDQYLSASITPKRATSFLEITVSLQTTLVTASALAVIAALFRNSGVDALSATKVYSGATANSDLPVTIQHRVLAGNTSATTFTVRAGPSSAGTLNVNGRVGAGIFGGVNISSIKITEVAE
jgi:hypothetical protein